MTTVQIKHRYTDAVLFECEVPEQHSGMSMRYALEQANKNGANLSGANLSYANLRDANLRGANLSDANLYGSNLSYANLRGANLSDANLYGSNLIDANLSYANLSDANLSYANLIDANLIGANLRDAKIDGEIVSITPINMTGLRWPILITDSFMRIGCQRHTHEEWASFGDDDINEMDSTAPEFWSQWREPLLAMCKAHASKVKPIAES